MTVVLVGAFLAAVVSGSSGFAFGLIGSAIWLHVLPPGRVVPLVVICSMLLNLALVWRLRHEIRPRLLWPFLAGALIGVPIGVASLERMDPALVRRGVGALLLFYSLYMLRRPHMPVVRLGVVGGRLADGAVGLLGGFMGGATSLNGLFPTMWCGLRGWNKNEQRGVFQPYILIVHGMTLFWLGGVGGLNMGTGRDVLLCVPALLIGGWLGFKLVHRVSDDGFRKVILTLFLLSGLSLVI
ncbi:MAG: sulfite exporter TauE/SafE family protein [Burkholderiaceae bacterium]